MMYKTIVLELIQSCPAMYEELRSTKRLLPAIESYAIGLKTSHETMKGMIRQEHPDRDPAQVASEAMEYVLPGFQQNLFAAWQTDEAEAFSLDAAMSFIRKASPLA